MSLMIFLALLVGAVPAFFIVFNSVFSDGGSPTERVATFVLTALAYAVLGSLFGYASPHRNWRWGLWLAAPAFMITGLYWIRERDSLLLILTYNTIAAAAGGFAARAATRFKSRVTD